MNLTMAWKLGADVQSYTGILTQDPYFNNLIIKGTAHMRFQELTANYKVIETCSDFLILDESDTIIGSDFLLVTVHVSSWYK